MSQTHTVQSQETPDTKISSIVREKQKTAEQRAEDYAYTINHALSCGTTDVVIQPIIAATLGVNIGCVPSDEVGRQKLTFAKFKHEVKHYLGGEIVGDALAVPATIMVQRMAPGFMQAVRYVLEPVFGDFFRMGAKHSARNWALHHDVPVDSKEYQERAQEIYQHEMDHLPQAAVWNMFAYPMGVCFQKMGGHDHTVGEIMATKLTGGLISNGMLIGGRALAPEKFRDWDQWNSKHIVMPVTRAVGKVVGLDETALKNVSEKRERMEDPRWSQRLPQVNDNEANDNEKSWAKQVGDTSPSAKPMRTA